MLTLDQGLLVLAELLDLLIDARVVKELVGQIVPADLPFDLEALNVLSWDNVCGEWWQFGQNISNSLGTNRFCIHSTLQFPLSQLVFVFLRPSQFHLHYFGWVAFFALKNAAVEFEEIARELVKLAHILLVFVQVKIVILPEDLYGLFSQNRQFRRLVSIHILTLL